MKFAIGHILNREVRTIDYEGRVHAVTVNEDDGELIVYAEEFDTGRIGAYALVDCVFLRPIARSSKKEE